MVIRRGATAIPRWEISGGCWPRLVIRKGATAMPRWVMSDGCRGSGDEGGCHCHTEVGDKWWVSAKCGHGGGELKKALWP